MKKAMKGLMAGSLIVAWIPANPHYPNTYKLGSNYRKYWICCLSSCLFAHSVV